jgi:hypothetical protein
MLGVRCPTNRHRPWAVDTECGIRAPWVKTTVSWSRSLDYRFVLLEDYPEAVRCANLARCANLVVQHGQLGRHGPGRWLLRRAGEIPHELWDQTVLPPRAGNLYLRRRYEGKFEGFSRHVPRDHDGHQRSLTVQRNRRLEPRRYRVGQPFERWLELECPRAHGGREPSGLCPRGDGSPRTGLTLWAGSRRRQGASVVVLAGRATHVP